MEQYFVDDGELEFLLTFVGFIWILDIDKPNEVGI